MIHKTSTTLWCSFRWTQWRQCDRLRWTNFYKIQQFHSDDNRCNTLGGPGEESDCCCQLQRSAPSQGPGEEGSEEFQVCISRGTSISSTLTLVGWRDPCYNKFFFPFSIADQFANWMFVLFAKQDFRVAKQDLATCKSCLATCGETRLACLSLWLTNQFSGSSPRQTSDHRPCG